MSKLRIYASACSKRQNESDTKIIRISQEFGDVPTIVNRGANHLSEKDENSAKKLSNDSRGSVSEASENMGCYLR